jgi:(2Fe-2S) ferredoxin
MKKPTVHILVCASFRVTGAPQGACSKKGAASLLQYLQEGINDRGIEDVAISLTNCLNVCDRGPVMVVYPQNYWYGGITTERIDAILDALASGAAVPDYFLT